MKLPILELTSLALVLYTFIRLQFIYYTVDFAFGVCLVAEIEVYHFGQEILAYRMKHLILGGPLQKNKQTNKEIQTRFFVLN